jgi:hypothetical protein
MCLIPILIPQIGHSFIDVRLPLAARKARICVSPLVGLKYTPKQKKEIDSQAQMGPEAGPPLFEHRNPAFIEGNPQPYSWLIPA